MHPEMMTVWSVFGADPSVAKSLDFIRKETPLPGWMNNIASIRCGMQLLSMTGICILEIWHGYVIKRNT